MTEIGAVQGMRGAMQRKLCRLVEICVDARKRGDEITHRRWRKLMKSSTDVDAILADLERPLPTR